MRCSQPVLVLGLSALLAVLGIVIVALRSANSHRDVLLNALQRSLEYAYDQAIAGTPNPRPEQPCSIPVSALRKVLLDTKGQRTILPAFVNAQDVFLPREFVTIPSDDLVCVVRIGDKRFYGITGKRAWREVSSSELKSWLHDSLATNAPTNAVNSSGVPPKR